MLFELSVVAPDNHTRDRLLQDAVEKAAKAKEQAFTVTDLLAAVYHCSSLPLMVTVHHEKSHADEQMVQRTIHDLGEGIIRLIDSIPISGNRYNFADKNHTVGLLSEATMLLAFQSYTLHGVGTGENTIVPSLFSQDKTPHRTNYGQANWDISVYERDDVIHDDPTGKLQVKFIRHPHNEARYHSDLSVVGVSPDLFPPNINVVREARKLAQSSLEGSYDNIRYDIYRLLDRVF